MRRHLSQWAFAALLTAVLCALRSAAPVRPRAMSLRMSGLPRVTVWAWERREDLRGIHTATTAVAYLDRTVIVDGRGMTVSPRRQGLLLPAAEGLVRIPVVRVETGDGALLNGATAEAVGSAIAAAAVQGSAALQVDFDARQSEREWYRSLLQRVRAKMPVTMPLSMTALASWCSYDNTWMQGLPVDEAVPMLFRMEPDRRRFAPNGRREIARDFAIREPLCLGSVGISTREAWPREMAGRRVYVFADEGWRRDGLEETVRELW